ncbi:MAG: hypothetical protein LBE27_07510 [Deltaproteobacteria bacterium]|jgi:hypothetical protein|nr:hypothetical protein [Deltaproteobacteria bacterium]
MAIALIILFALIPIAIAILTLVAIPEYARHSQEAALEADDYDELAQDAYHRVQLAEEGYYVQHSKYTTDYDALDDDDFFTMNPDVKYGKIKLCEGNSGYIGYQFTVRHKRSTTHTTLISVQTK